MRDIRNTQFSQQSLAIDFSSQVDQDRFDTRLLEEFLLFTKILDRHPGKGATQMTQKDKQDRRLVREIKKVLSLVRSEFPQNFADNNRFFSHSGLV